MKRTAIRCILTALLSVMVGRATPITGVTLPDPPLMTPRQIVTIDLGNGLIWEGPAMTPEEWDAAMSGLPPAAGFGIGMDTAATPTPEPSTFLLLSAGIAAGIWWRRRH